MTIVSNNMVVKGKGLASSRKTTQVQASCVEENKLLAQQF
ncbi:hypothetical protein JOF46_004420 [Paeniglutamicibacter psychrophenolicus]|uniref:Uncharacterized protein n=1 Tax=Paeniglutamicibacter psychrophenolicus TaxID=257454 RepID=A0ABS4WJQ0_9MICC|nr:hypothetical protein [Paeniglutamicibacter psychrophenolicus]